MSTPAAASPVKGPSDEQPVDPASAPVAARPALLDRCRIPVRAFIATRRFTLWSSLVIVTACAVLLGLGTWQLARLHQKNALVSHIQAQLAQPERDLRLRLPIRTADWQDLDYRRVVLQGDWLDLYPLKIVPRTYEGQNGYHLLMPLRLQDGQIVLVNRGWVPDKTELGPTSQLNQTAALVAGIVRLAPPAKPFGMMDNNPARNVWAWPDIAAIAHRIGVDRVAPIILYAERAPDTTAGVPAKNNQPTEDVAAPNAADAYPIGGQATLEIRNEHKQYALTWYSLALALLVIWLTAAKAPPVKDGPVTATPDD